MIVHAAAEAAFALGLARDLALPRPVVLLSAPGAAGYMGAPWFLGLVAAAAGRCPGVPHLAVLDCADAPGHALAALRAGARVLVLDPSCPAYAAVAGAAAEVGAAVWPAPPPAFDLGRFDPRRPLPLRGKLAAWFAAAG